MKFSDRPAAERVAIDAWIRVITMAREDACMKMTDDFQRVREESISASSAEVKKMLGFYAAYRAGRHQVSYADYFQVSNPVEYAAILAREKMHP